MSMNNAAFETCLLSFYRYIHFTFSYI